MTESLQLLFPCCYPGAPVGAAQKNEKRFSSASAHAATAVAVAIVVGAGAALAVYFLNNGVVKWTAIAGGGAALVSGTAIYTMLRFACGTLPQKFSIGIRTHDWQRVDEKAETQTVAQSRSASPIRNFPIDHTSGSRSTDEPDGRPTDDVSQLDANLSDDEKVLLVGSLSGRTQSDDSNSTEESISENQSILNNTKQPEAISDDGEIVIDTRWTKIYVDRDKMLSREDKLKLFEEKLNSGSLIMFRSDDAYAGIKYLPPTPEQPYGHFVIPIRIDEYIFEVEPTSLGSTKRRGEWETMLHLKYLGRSFEGFADAYFHLEDILNGGPFYFAPKCFQVAQQQWFDSFVEWNQTQKGQQRYLTYGDLISFERDKFIEGFLELSPYIVSDIGDVTEESSYYMPDYVGYEFDEEKQVLLITRSQASPLVNVECMDHISDTLFEKMHAIQCRIPLKQPLDCYDIRYLPDTKMLAIRNRPLA